MRWGILIIAVFLNGLANIFIKAGMLKSHGKDAISILTNIWTSWPIVIGILFFGLALVAYSYMLSSANLSIVYPIMTSMSFLIVVIASWLVFGEVITLSNVIGFVLIILGIWLVAR